MGLEIYKLLMKNITSKVHNGYHYVAQPITRLCLDIYKSKSSCTIFFKPLNSSCFTIPVFRKQIPPYVINQQVYKKVKREYRAVLSLLKRSSLPNVQHVKCLHTSAFYCQEKAPNNQQKPNQNNDDKSSLVMKAFLWMLSGYMLVITLSLLFPSTSEDVDAIHYVSWNEFIHHMLVKGEVELIIVRPDVNVVTIYLYDGAVIKGKKADYKVYHMNIVDSNTFEAKLRETEQHLGLLSQHGGGGVPITYERSSDAAGRLISSLIVAGVLFALFTRFRTAMPPMSMDPFSVLGRAKFTLFDPSTGKGVKFTDVAGLHEAKMEVMEFVDYLKRPNYYKNLGAKVPKGALLLGPPGCGKTLLAKAVATESNVPFLSMNGSEFIEMIGGLGAARVRNLFKEGRKLAPCIIYIDEIDAIGKKRSGGSRNFSGADGEGEQTLNQLLVELDGMASKEGVIMLASTNRADVLDKALLRPGRFDRHILIDFPTLSERAEIFEQHLKVIALEKDPKHYSRRLAFLTPRFSGADIANVCNEAALHAARGKKSVVRGTDLEYAVERVVGGTEKRSHAMSLSEKRIVAFHESGHALVGWLLPHTDALLKVTIVPRTNLALGFAQYTPTDQKLYSKEELYERMCMMLGGRAAEAVTFNSITTGAQDDLKKVNQMAYAQVRQFGMNDQVGLVSFIEDEKNERKRPYSKQLVALIDLEVNKLIATAYQETERILTKNKEKLHLLAEALLERETLNYDDVEMLIGSPPHGKKNAIETMDFGWLPREDVKDAMPTKQDPKETTEFAI